MGIEPKPLNMRNWATTHANSSFRFSDRYDESTLEFLTYPREYPNPPQFWRQFGDTSRRRSGGGPVRSVGRDEHETEFWKRARRYWNSATAFLVSTRKGALFGMPEDAGRVADRALNVVVAAGGSPTRG